MTAAEFDRSVDMVIAAMTKPRARDPLAHALEAVNDAALEITAQTPDAMFPADAGERLTAIRKIVAEFDALARHIPTLRAAIGLDAFPEAGARKADDIWKRLPKATQDLVEPHLDFDADAILDAGASLYDATVAALSEETDKETEAEERAAHGQFGVGA